MANDYKSAYDSMYVRHLVTWAKSIDASINLGQLLYCTCKDILKNKRSNTIQDLEIHTLTFLTTDLHCHNPTHTTNNIPTEQPKTFIYRHSYTFTNTQS